MVGVPPLVRERSLAVRGGGGNSYFHIYHGGTQRARKKKFEKHWSKGRKDRNFRRNKTKLRNQLKQVLREDLKTAVQSSIQTAVSNVSGQKLQYPVGTVLNIYTWIKVIYLFVDKQKWRTVAGLQQKIKQTAISAKLFLCVPRYLCQTNGFLPITSRSSSGDRIH